MPCGQRSERIKEQGKLVIWGGGEFVKEHISFGTSYCYSVASEELF